MDPRFADKLKTPMFGGQGFFNQTKSNGDSKQTDKKKDSKKEKKEKNDSTEDVHMMSVDKQDETRRFSKKGDKHKIEIDDRFRGVLTESRFGASEAAAVDQYGRKKNKNKSKSKNGSGGELSEFYTLGEDAEKKEVGAEEEEDVQKDKSTVSTASAPSQSKGGKLNASSSKSEIESRLDYLNRLARGEISASGSDDDDEDEYDMNSSVEGSSGDDNSDIDGEETRRMIPGDEVDYGEATSRIAIQNCDWEHIGASDLLAILHSFCPAGKFVKNLTIYLSDFGKQRLEVDERFGPRNIWKNEEGKGKKSIKDDSEDDSEDDEEEEEDDDDDDDDDESSNDDDDNSNEDDEEEDGPKKYEKGDFERKPGDVGVVLQTDDDDAIDQKGGKKKPNTVQISSDINQDKLREYELSKLRYYFAVADCDCLETAMVLYEQLDGLEMEHSSMELDLRYIPDDISFTGRTVKDQCNSVKTDYEPSEFVINALQRTSVDCTWEDGDKARNSKLTTLSSWKTLNESDFQQYLASSDSSDNEDDIDDAEKRRRAKNLRKLVGGEDSDVDQDEEDGFFLKESSKKLADKFQERTIVVHTKDDSDDDSDGNGGRDYDVEETVFEAAKRKLAEKKKQKKLQQQKNKNNKNNKNNDDSDDNIVDTSMISASKGKDKGFGNNNNNNSNNSNKSKKNDSKSSYKQDSDNSSGDEDAKSKMVKDKLDLMFSDSTDIANNYDMIEIMKREKHKSKKNKFKKSKHSKANDDDAIGISAAQDSFQVDTKDPRFSRLYTDHTFGIDPTSTEFKKTNAMMKVVKHVSENRQQHIDDSADRSSSNSNSNSGNSNSGNSNSNISSNNGASVQSLVNKLKRKFKDQ